MQTTAHLTSDTPPFSNRRECWFWAGWEPDRYYRRIGARGTAFFGNGEWVPQWRKRLESVETLAAIRAAGATVVMTRFYKGMGPEVERPDWETLQTYVERAHEAGIKVLGYFQGRSLFGEYLFNERPEAVRWVARKRDGTVDTWGGASNRFAPCLGNAEYRQMMEEIASEGLSIVGLDGLHMDNNYTNHCYCDGCKGRFREWLSERGDLEERTGIIRADYVEPPALSAQAELVPDPLALLWIEFGVQQRLEFMKAIRARVKAEKPGAVLTGNPAYLRTFASRITHALDAAREGEACDGLCIENGNRPRFGDGVLYTQADKLLAADASGLKSWVTGWASGSEGHGAPQGAQALWAVMAEEFSFHRAALGNNWALRAGGEGPSLLLENERQGWAEFQRARTFFHELDERLGRGRSQWGEVALYIDTEALSISPGADAFAAQAALQKLLLARVPVRLLFQGQPVPKETHTVLVMSQRGLREAELERLSTELAARGGELWLVGRCGTMDEWGVPRNRSRFHRLTSLPAVRSFTGPGEQWVAGDVSGGQYFRGLSPAFNADGEVAFQGVLEALVGRLRLRVEAPEGVLRNVETGEGGALLLHLRDVREEACGLEAGAVQVRGVGSDAKGYAAAWEPGCTLPDAGADGAAALPAFAHYACVVGSGTVARPGAREAWNASLSARPE